MVKKCFTFRCYPNKTQQIQLNKTFGSVRFVYNTLLAACKELPKIQGKRKLSVHPNELKNTLLPLKEEFSFLKEVDSVALQASCENLSNAYDRFFQKLGGFPRFKKKTNKQSYTTKNTNHSIRFLSFDSKKKNQRLKLPKLGAMKIVNSYPTVDFSTLVITKATIKQEPNGQVYVSILFKDVEIPALPKTNEAIGLDMGLTHFLAKSDGSFVQGIHALQKHENRLIKAQKVLSRRIQRAIKEGRSIRDGKNIQKARLKVAKIHAKIKHIREDFLHKVSKQLVQDYDQIALEKLNIRDMLQNGQLAKHIQDASWSMFTDFLRYKAEWYEKCVHFVVAAYTSQTCNQCGHVDKENRHRLVFKCTNCGHVDHADTNAAKNIKQKANFA